MAAGEHLLQGNFKHLGAMASQGPAAQPAAIAGGIDTDHLVQLLIAAEADAITLMQGLLMQSLGGMGRNGGWRRQGGHGGRRRRRWSDPAEP